VRQRNLALLLKALSFAADKHRNQRRKDRQASPYINHPIALARVLTLEGGVADAPILAAALLHDTIEDTRTSYEELRRVFGYRVARTVLEVTDNKRLRKQTRKRLQVEHAPALSRAAKLVKLADKICNLRDLGDRPPVGWSKKRRREYFDWAKQVADGMRGTNRRLEAAFDAAYARRPRLIVRQSR
jgi:GTP diphosphokinase / guanosine-3',5'-bis(diphosphate) 3'-diphosphatase